ncbi:hypothetical protein C5167_023830 [Papaver somniferum]|uniref:Uncharacterized protein n=1 Tax=Papaver somniferum TaxID=3469 RepID=A0A4Y7JQW7_PAPSO|nr:hypothetical protein C5167_023830 [Papaver somniferum]
MFGVPQQCTVEKKKDDGPHPLQIFPRTVLIILGSDHGALLRRGCKQSVISNAIPKGWQWPSKPKLKFSTTKVTPLFRQTPYTARGVSLLPHLAAAAPIVALSSEWQTLVVPKLIKEVKAVAGKCCV